MENKTERYSDAELEEFRILIQGKIEKAEEDLRILREQFTNNMDNGTEDTSPSFKSFEEGSETMSKEANAQLAARQEKFLRDLRAAIIRIENKTYGMCRVTGNRIEKERLKLVPHATMSMEAKLKQR
ncbi:MAG: TraR/DksA family transcriptional regulator [Bacteroidetes bacterium]|jgi:DnaK suppressor protein|nr:TraR/DksA family transcriptional regulator [Cryomorphaceae bacterium]MDA0363790.1 TraR/DksA family transcriptional regulator [Bacteroidota bacterium]NCZ94219.1 TraR/DksA family transcriptional regulator [Flavobacteriia bacterium]MDA0828351.1 TraR/DksA family transcriptional regulator [Bacteroidota bacterium]MDA1199844.1 TraR/DksA family transcriptional regulator [Bacteroidota bacterium]